jgi:putative serine protease PepD
VRAAAPAATAAPARAVAATAAPAAAPAGQVAQVASALLPVVVQIEARGAAATSTGAGVIMRRDGYLLTNRHLVVGARSLQVTLPSAETLKAWQVGADAATDLAVVKVDRRGLPAASFGRSADLRVGETVVAVGSPFGFRGTVTAGIVSALHRVVTLQDGHELVDAIQTDAAINPGNSGGALADAAGQVVGINSALAVPDPGQEASAGVGFAVPSDEALAVAALLIAHKPVRMAYLGIETAADLSPTVAARYRLGHRTGALVTRVLRPSAAARAGLRTGDLVVSLDGTAVNGADELKVALRRLAVGRPVPIVAVRNGRPLELEITPTDQPQR